MFTNLQFTKGFKMMASKILKTLLIPLLFCNISYSQKSEYSNKCEIALNLLDSADQTFFRFSKIVSTVTILDINGILTGCSINKIGDVKINVVSSGAEVEKVKKQGIFSAPSGRKELFVFTKESFEGQTIFRVYQPWTNGEFHWVFVEKKGRYHFKKKQSGWF